MSYFIASDTKKRYNIFGEGGGKKVCEKYHLKLLAQIPLDTNISELKDTQKIPITLGDKNIKESYKEIVKKIVL